MWHTEINSLKLRKACGIHDIPNECLRHFQDDLWFTWPIYLIIAFGCPIFQSLGRKLPKPCKDPKFPQNLRPISLLSTTGKLLKKSHSENSPRAHWRKRPLNASQFGFRVRHSTTLQCKRLTDHVTIISTINCLLPWCSWTSKKPLIQRVTLACYVSYLNWNIRPVWSSLLALFFHNANSVFRWKEQCLRQGKFTQWCHKLVLSPILFNMYVCVYIYINDAPRTHGAQLALFAGTCLYATDRKEGFIVENSRAVSAQWKPGVSARISKLTKITLGGSTSLAVVDRFGLILRVTV
jgi:hypothetical protein